MIDGEMSLTEQIWIGIGLVGQAMFAMRFIVQWLYSEKHKRSRIPTAFWYFSIGGAAVLLSYAIYRMDPVFILGQSTGFFIYARNLVLIRREHEELAATDPEKAAES